MGADGAQISEEYLSQVTHELRGSLNAILGWAEFLRSSPCDELARVRAAETIIRHARQQSWMIGEFIDTWRLASGTLRLRLTALNIANLVEAAVEAVEPQARARQVHIDLHHDPAVTGRARGDAKRVTQAMTTLLANAVHFAPTGSLVEVRLYAMLGAAALTVHDRGPGAPRGALPFLFDRTRPKDAGRASPRGDFRLGLSFVRDVVTCHGGSIVAESAGEDAGMTFRIVLPVEASSGTSAAAFDAVAGPVDSAVLQRLVGLRVLLVDDEPDAREALTGILRHYGAIVRAAGSAADAMAALQDQPVDVLLADIGMPGADGYDLIRYVRSLESSSASHVPAVAVTAFTSDADRRRALDAGYQVHLSKPIDPSALVATVAALGRPSASSIR
jgi:CheY-like chemotaxis protein